MAEIKEKKCPECGTKMILGRRRDKGDSFSVLSEAWISGKPKKGLTNWFSGKGKAISVLTYACPNCGRLVSYLDKQ